MRIFKKIYFNEKALYFIKIGWIVSLPHMQVKLAIFKKNWSINRFQEISLILFYLGGIRAHPKWNPLKIKIFQYLACLAVNIKDLIYTNLIKPIMLIETLKFLRKFSFHHTKNCVYNFISRYLSVDKKKCKSNIYISQAFNTQFHILTPLNYENIDSLV